MLSIQPIKIIKIESKNIILSQECTTGPDQCVLMLGLTRPFDVCIAKGRFSCLEAPSIDDPTKVKMYYAYAKSK